MDRSKTKTRNELHSVLRALAARFAIVAGVVSAIFYIALKTTTDPLVESDFLDPAPPASRLLAESDFLDMPPPALKLSAAPVQEQAAPLRLAVNFRGRYLVRAKYRSSSSSPFEGD